MFLQPLVALPTGSCEVVSSVFRWGGIHIASDSCKRQRQVQNGTYLLLTYLPTTYVYSYINSQLDNEPDYAEERISRNLGLLSGVPYRRAARVRRRLTYSPELEPGQAYDYSSARRASILPLQRVIGPQAVSTDYYRTLRAGREI